MIFSPNSTMRRCCTCKTRRSTTQFDGTSAVCRRCVLRAPKPAPVQAQQPGGAS